MNLLCTPAHRRENRSGWIIACERVFTLAHRAKQDPSKKACRHPPIDGRATREGERIAGTHFTMPPNIDLRLSPLTVGLYEILDVLVAIGFDLARSSEKETITRPLNDLMTRDRQGLELASRMLRELAARHEQDGGCARDHYPHGASRAEEVARGDHADERTPGIVTGPKMNVVASSR